MSFACWEEPVSNAFIERRFTNGLACRRKPELIFVLGSSLLAGTGQAVHGGAAGRPVFQHFVLNQLVDDLFGHTGFHIQDFGQVVEVEFGFCFLLFLQAADDQLFCLFLFHWLPLF
jgi:hypothetical protein